MNAGERRAAERQIFSGKPYPGLRAFRIEEYPIFFGRDGCLDQMIRSLENDRFLAVVGASGSGKSSIVRAAFFRELQLGLAGMAGTRWQFADIGHPGETDPFDQLARALIKSRPADAPPLDLNDATAAALSAELQEGNFTLNRWAQEGGNLPEGSNLLILVDQFEELFLFDEASDKAAAKGGTRRRLSGYDRSHVSKFVDLLLRTIERSDTPIYIVITMRAEYLNLCTTFRGLADRFSADAVIPPRMERDQCREAIVGPSRYLERVGSENRFTFEPELVDTLLDELEKHAPFEDSAASDDNAELDKLDRLGRQADQLPLMQHVLNQMWREAAAARKSPSDEIRLTRDAYRERGGISGSLGAVGDRIYNSLSDRQKVVAERVFCSLVTGARLSQAVRRPCDLKTLMREADATEDEVRDVVDRFRDEDVCFLTPFALHDRPAERIRAEQKISISHESLIRQWETLKRWYQFEIEAGVQWKQIAASVRADHAFESRGERILYRARQLIRPSQTPALWRGVTLSGYATWWAAHRPYLGWAERYDPKAGENYPAAERMLEESLSWRTFRNRASGATAASLLALVAFATWQTVSANAATKIADEAKNAAKAEKQNAAAAEKMAASERQSAQAATIAAGDALKQSQKAKAESERAKAMALEAQSRAQAAIAQASQTEIRAKSAENMAAVQTQQAMFARNAAIEPIFAAVRNYAVEGQANENIASRASYERVASSLDNLRSMGFSPTSEQRVEIADVHLAALSHAVSQLDRKFLERAVTNASSAIEALPPEQAGNRRMRLWLGKGRLALWNGDLATAQSNYGALANDRSVIERIRMSAQTGLAEATLMAGGTPDLASLECGDGAGNDRLTEKKPEDMLYAVAQVRCLQMRGRLITASRTDDSIEPDENDGFGGAKARIDTLPSSLASDVRIAREVPMTALGKGDALTEYFRKQGSLDDKEKSIDAHFAYFDATGEDTEIVPLPTLAEAAASSNSSGIPLTPSTPLRRYATVDILTVVRSRIRSQDAIARWSDYNGVGGERDARAWNQTTPTMARIIYPATFATSYLVDDIAARSGDGAFTDIADQRARFVELLRQGAAVAPLVLGARTTDTAPLRYDIQGVGDLTISSLSFAADALRLNQVLNPGFRTAAPRPASTTAVPAPPEALKAPPRMAAPARRGLFSGLFKQAPKTDAPPAPLANAAPPPPKATPVPSGIASISSNSPSVRESIGAMAAVIGDLRENGGFQTDFLHYVPPAEDGSTGRDSQKANRATRFGDDFVLDPKKIDRLTEAAARLNRVGAPDAQPEVDALVAAVAELNRAQMNERNALLGRDEVQDGDVWTDRYGVALGGIDVVDCFESAGTDSGDDDSEDIFVKYLRSKAGALGKMGVRIDAKPGKEPLRSQYCEPFVGNLAIRSELNGIIWLFRTHENKLKFDKAPASYMPFGSGYELRGLLSDAGTRTKVMPSRSRRVTEQGRIVDGRLYFINEQELEDAEARAVEDAADAAAAAADAAAEAAKSM